MEYSRLIADATKSPICETPPHIRPITKHAGTNPASTETFLLTNKANNVKHRPLPIIPAIEPSIDFLGDTTGANLCLPKRIPKQ